MTGCNTPEITFEELFSEPEKYNEKNIIIEGFFFHGFESFFLCNELKYYEENGRYSAIEGPKIWVNSGISRDIHDGLYQQDMMGPTEYFGKLSIEGLFEYGNRYGHLGSHSSQITPSKVELLPWFAIR